MQHCHMDDQDLKTKVQCSSAGVAGVVAWRSAWRAPRRPQGECGFGSKREGLATLPWGVCGNAACCATSDEGITLLMILGLGEDPGRLP
jgi:hypothetical protein